MHIPGHPKPFTRYRTLPSSQKTPSCLFLVNVCTLPPPNATTVLIFFPPQINCACSRTSHIWNHIVCTLLYGLPLLSILILKFIYLCIAVLCYFLLLSSIVLCDRTKVRLCIFLLGCMGCFQFLVFMNNGIMNILI